MLQSFLESPTQIAWQEQAVPAPGTSEVLVRVHLAGICGSDLHLFHNGHSLDAPLTLGHEALGTIVEVGKGADRSRIGQRVVIEPNIPCGDCPECRMGRGSVCRNKRIIGVREAGCFAEYVALPSDFVHMLSDSVSERDAVTIEPATVALAALRRSGVQPADPIAVVGLGAIGMLLCHAARVVGHEVWAVDPVESKRDKAETLGVKVLPPADAEELEARFSEAGILSVFECAGAAKTAELAIGAAPRGADIILLGLSESAAGFVPKRLARKGNRIIPSLIYEYPQDFKLCIRMVEEGTLQPGIVVEKEYPFRELQEALQDAARSKTIKTVIRFGE